MCSGSLFLTKYSTYHSFLINLPCSLRAHYANLVTSKWLLFPLQLLWLTLSQLSSKVQFSLNHSSNLKFHSELLSYPQFKTGPRVKVFLWERAFFTYLSLSLILLLPFLLPLGLRWEKRNWMKKGKSLFSYFCSLAFVFFHDSIPECLPSSGTLCGFFQRVWSGVWISTSIGLYCGCWALGISSWHFLFHLLVLCLVSQTCLTLCNPMDCSPPGSSTRQEYWSGLPFPFPGGLSNPGIKPGSLASQADSLPLSHQGSPNLSLFSCIYPAGIQLSSVLCSTPRKPTRYACEFLWLLSIQPWGSMVCLSLRHCQPLFALHGSSYLGGKEPPWPSILFWAHSSTTQMKYLFLDLI